MRDIAVQEATKNATLVPLKVMEIAYSGFGLINEMVENGNPNSISDAGVGALAIRSCIRGAFLNVRINASGLSDKVFVTEVIAKGAEIETLAMAAEDQVIKTINQRIITH
jgi:glutamate formiminotransferase/formiminotetrahydrofolate cyclodeaminase